MFGVCDKSRILSKIPFQIHLISRTIIPVRRFCDGRPMIFPP